MGDKCRFAHGEQELQRPSKSVDISFISDAST